MFSDTKKSFISRSDKTSCAVHTVAAAALSRHSHGIHAHTHTQIYSIYIYIIFFHIFHTLLSSKWLNRDNVYTYPPFFSFPLACAGYLNANAAID